METKEIIAYSSSAFLAFVNLFFTESIKEVIKKFFSVKSGKQVKRLYWLFFIIAVALPLLLVYTSTANKTNTKEPIINHPNKIEPIKNH